MRIVLYTDKTISQCMTALSERLQMKGTSSRPGLEGWVEKKGSFAISATTRVGGYFPRTTRLTGKAEKFAGYTMITANVAAGASRRGLMLIFIGLAVVGAALLATGNTLLGIGMLPLALLLYIPLAGDDANSEYLIGELQKTLKAKFTPPSKPAPAKAKPATKTPAR